MKVSDCSTINIAEWGCKLVATSQIDGQRVTVSIENAAELIGACAHHRGNGVLSGADVGCQLIILVSLVANVHQPDKGVPVIKRAYLVRILLGATSISERLHLLGGNRDGGGIVGQRQCGLTIGYCHHLSVGQICYITCEVCRKG